MHKHIIVGFTIQLVSIVTKKRGGERQAKDHCTDITLRNEETSILRVIILFMEELSTLRVTYSPEGALR